MEIQEYTLHFISVCSFYMTAPTSSHCVKIQGQSSDDVVRRGRGIEDPPIRPLAQ